MVSSAAESSLPPLPTNGRPERSSSRPGASPTSMILAFPGPSPGTALVLEPASGHLWQTDTSSAIESSVDLAFKGVSRSVSSTTPPLNQGDDGASGPESNGIRIDRYVNKGVGMVGFEPTVYRFLQLQCHIIHAAVSSNLSCLTTGACRPACPAGTLERVTVAGLHPHNGSFERRTL